MTSRLVLVLGMHRSGTSLLANAMHCFGAELGEAAEWNGPDNPTGFWEHQGILTLNEALLTQMLGRTWHDESVPVLWSPLRLGANPMARWVDHALRMLTTELREHPLFAIKEPRMCRLLPYWRPIFDAVHTEVSVLHVVRHPMAVARSLLARNGIPLDRGLALWLDHVRRARVDVDRTWMQTTVGYDRFLRCPTKELARIGRDLALDLQPDATTRFLRDAIRPDLHHQQPEGELPPDVAEEWAIAQLGATL